MKLCKKQASIDYAFVGAIC